MLDAKSRGLLLMVVKFSLMRPQRTVDTLAPWLGCPEVESWVGSQRSLSPSGIWPAATSQRPQGPSHLFISYLSRHFPSMVSMLGLSPALRTQILKLQKDLSQ